MRTPHWLALAALAGVLLVLVLVLPRDESSDAARAGAPAGGAAEPRHAAAVAPPELSAPERDAAASARVARGAFAAPTGVRLAGQGRVAGRVVDGGGAGVADVRVELLGVPPSMGHWVERFLRFARREAWVPNTEPVAGAVSGPDGAFSFEGVRRGTYFCDARGEAWVIERPVQVRVDGAGEGGPVTVRVRPAGAVRGRVERADGRPVGGARVALFHGVGVLLTALRRGEARYLETETDSDGRFALVGVPAGEGYELAAVRRGIAATHRSGLTVRAGRALEVVLVAREGGTVEGRVVVAAAVPGADEPRPVPGAHVGVLPLGLRDLHFAPEILETVSTRTDEEGRYVLRHAPPGQVDVVAWAPGFVPAVSETLTVGEGVRTPAPDVELPTGAVATGRVVDSAGQPIRGVQVRWDVTGGLVDDEVLRLTPFFAPLIDAFEFPETDAEGRFGAGPILGQPPHTLSFEREGYAVVEKSWDGESTLEVVLEGGGAVEGIVMDSTRAEPVRRFTVLPSSRVHAPGRPAAFNPIAGGEMIEDPGGRFRVEGLQPGSRTLHVTAPGYAPASVEVEVTEGAVTRGVIASLARGGVVRGHVVDGDGVPIEDALVLAKTAGGGLAAEAGGDPTHADVRVGVSIGSSFGDIGLAAGLGLLGPDTVRSDASGAFELEAVEPGELRVVAVHPDYAGDASEPCVLEEGGVLEGVEVALHGGGVLHGTVRDLTGAPVPETIVVAVSPGGMDERNGGGFLFQDLSDAEGRYRIERMSPGSYFVATTRGDEALHPLSFLGRFNFDLVSVPEGAEVRHDVTDTSAGGCRVFGVVTSEGDPVRGGALVALDRGADNMLGLDFKMAPVDARGRYEFVGLRPGPFQINYDGPGPDVQLDVEVPDLSEYRLDLALPEGRIAGVVVDASTGEAVDGSEVTLRRLGGEPATSGLLGAFLARETRLDRTFTGEGGRFDFGGLQAGGYELAAGGPMWGDRAGRSAPSEPRRIELRDGERLDGLEIALQPTLRLHGRVVDAGGAGVAEARVVAYRAGADLRAVRAVTAADGSFELEGLGGGEYELSATHDDFAPGSPRRVELPENAPVELSLSRGARITVDVFDASGAPVAGAFGVLVAASGGAAERERGQRAFVQMFQEREGISGSDGRLELGRFAAGEYRLEVQRGSLRPVREAVEVRAAEDLHLTVQLN